MGRAAAEQLIADLYEHALGRKAKAGSAEFDGWVANAVNGMAAERIVAAMWIFWLDNLAFIKGTPFTYGPTAANRYDYTGGPYPWGDGIILRAIIGHFRPKRVIEIGSGYSTACMLDSAEHAGLSGFHVTCIEPYPERLQSLLRPDDAHQVTQADQGRASERRGCSRAERYPVHRFDPRDEDGQRRSL